VERRTWGSNPQALSGNGFQVMNTASWFFLSTPDCACCAGQRKPCLAESKEPEATTVKEATPKESSSPSGRFEARIAEAVDKVYRSLRHNRLTRAPWAVIQTFSKAEGALLSGSMAYYTFLSLLPLLMIAGFVLGTISHGNEALQEAISTGVGRLFRGIGGRELLEQLIRARTAFGIVGLVTVGYAGSGFVGAVTACLNRMWEAPSGRNPVGQKLVNLLVAVLLGTALLASVGLTIWAEYATPVALDDGFTSLTRWIELVASPSSLFLVLLLLYRVLPARRLSWQSQVPGALLGTAGIELLKRAFTFWAQHSAGQAVLPRSVVSIVLLLVWLGFFGQMVLYGAAFNVVRDRQRRGVSVFPAGSLSE
jgi:membrane protein